MINRMNAWILVICLMAITACGSDHEKPEARSNAALSGKISVGTPIQNAPIKVYSFSGGQKGALLAELMSTSADGAYAFDLNIPSQPILIEVSGGHYDEMYSSGGNGATVNLSPQRSLTALDFHNGSDGEAHHVDVNPWTHIATGLARYKIANGTPVNTAISQANGQINQIVGGFDILTTESADLRNTEALSTASNQSISHGLLMAAVSSWTYELSLASGDTPAHTNINSVSLAETMFKDITSDGLLDGEEADTPTQTNTAADATPSNKKNGSVTESENPARKPISIGTLDVSSNTYRNHFAQHVLKVFNDKNINKSGLTAADAGHIADALNTATAGVYTDDTVLPVDDEAPVIASSDTIDLQDLDSFIVTLSDNVAVADVQFTVDSTILLDTPEVALTNPNTNEYTASLTFDTQSCCGEGVDHVLTVTATDVKGNRATKDFNIRFLNSAPMITVASSDKSNTKDYTLVATVNSPFSTIVQIKVNDELLDASIIGNGDQMSVTFEKSVPLPSEAGDNAITIEAVDQIGLSTVLNFSVFLDSIPPALVQGPHQQQAFFSGIITTQRAMTDIDNYGLIIRRSDFDISGLYPMEDQGTTPNRPVPGFQILTQSTIPYFSFTVDDAVTKDPVNMLWEYRLYKTSDTSVIDIETLWQSFDFDNLHVHRDDALTRVYIPITTEFMGVAWFNSAPNFTTFQLDIRVFDEAGSRADQSFQFAPVFTN